LPHGGKYLTLKYKYKYKYFETVLEYYSSTSTSTKYYISGPPSNHAVMVTDDLG